MVAWRRAIRGTWRAGRVADVSRRAVDNVAGVAERTAAWLNAQGDRLKATMDNLVDDTRKYVSAHPVKSLGFALAACFLISRLIR
jgi:ElaB/YqjD/DUF883 family membrane-anchored ribosome-binding protein